MFLKFFSSMFFFVAIMGNAMPAMAKNVEAQDIVSQWNFYGEGFVALDIKNNSVVLSEVLGSQGVMLVSPETFKANMSISFEIMPLTQESVLVTQIGLSDKGSSDSLLFADDYNGEQGVLVSEKESYFFAYHNAAHKRKPFIRKYPQDPKNQKELIELENNVLDTTWHRVEIGKKDGKIWMALNGKPLLGTDDVNMLGNGHVAFRLRGTKDRIAIAMVKNVSIKEF